MIIVLFGQPHSGKTTLAEALRLRTNYNFPAIDGDEIRDLFKNKDFSRAGRCANLNRISDIAAFLATKQPMVVVSAVYPYAENRAYLESVCDKVLWVHLSYNGERGRESYHVKDFELPAGECSNLMMLNTSNLDVGKCVETILAFYHSL